MRSIFNVYRKLIGATDLFSRTTSHVQMTGEFASNLIKQKILDNRPLMISRFGSNELNCILNYLFIQKSGVEKFVNLAKGIPYFNGFKQSIIENMYLGAGFFPSNASNLKRYSILSLNDLQNIDILGSWLNQEQYIFPLMNSDHIRVRLGDLTPLRHENPWSEALKGKRVLVIHPFEETIRSQYNKRQLLFEDQRVLPEFDLLTLKAVQSIAGSSTRHNDWFSALDFMKQKVSEYQFDIAIIGCGAYGMPLASFIKSLGKQAIHLGGETQTLFGIKGKRWETPTYNYQTKFYNQFWVRPLEEERPKNADNVEGGCYW